MKSSNRVWLLSVWSWKVWSTTKPRVATRVAGFSASLRLMVPHCSRATCQVIGVPGTPADSPLLTASAKGIGAPVPSSTKESVFISAGAVSRPSMVWTSPVAASK